MNAKTSQQNIDQVITLSLQASLFPTVHPGAISSPGKKCTYTQMFAYCNRKRDSLERVLSLLYGPVLMLTCPLQALSVDREHHGHSDRSAPMKPPYAAICDALYVLTPFYHFHISAICATVALLQDHTRQSYWWSYLGLLLVGTNHFITVTPHNTYQFGNALNQWSSHHSLALLRVTSLLLPIVPVSNSSTSRTDCSLSA